MVMMTEKETRNRVDLHIHFDAHRHLKWYLLAVVVLELIVILIKNGV